MKVFKNIFYFITLLLLVGGFLLWNSCQFNLTENEIENVSPQSYFKIRRVEKDILPDSAYLNIPFTSQAPYQIWDKLHDDACEEASIIMVYYYLIGKELTKEIAEQEIVNMVNWQIKNWGGHFDLSAKKMTELFEGYFGSTLLTISGYENLETIYPHTEDLVVGIKKELANGNPVIVPAAGRLLDNPYFTPPGPEYHVLVIKGYDDEKSEFITNDPGTKRGADFRYSYQVLENAVHDFNNGNILNGKKIMIIIK